MQARCVDTGYLWLARWVIGTAVVGGIVAGALAPAVRAKEGRTVHDGVYSEAQAKRGEALYVSKCMECHGDNLRGLDYAPALAGAEFRRVWNNTPLSELLEKIQQTMPQALPDSLNRKETADLISYMLQVNKFPAVQSDLSDDVATLSTILIAQ